MKPKTKLLVKRRLMVPIYDAHLWIVVAADKVREARVAMNDTFGPLGDDDDFSACLCWTGYSTFGLFFEKKLLNETAVAHEVFHATHRILQWCGVVFSTTNHEPFAALHGYLQSEVNKVLRQARLIK